jgi:hypothetical protein
MTAQLLIPLLSSFAGIVIGAVVSGLYTLRAGHKSYINDYYKVVVAKRVAAYEQLERLIISLKTSVVDKEDLMHPYHLIFAKDDTYTDAYRAVAEAMNQALWLSDAAFEKTQELNRLFYRLASEGSVIAFGKRNYQKIAQLRAELEDILALDMASMHDVRRFFRKKKKQSKSGFGLIRL